MRARYQHVPDPTDVPDCSIAKRLVAVITSMVMTFQPMFAYANPTGGVVSAGSATITQSGNTLEINETSNKAIINWTGFNIAPGETTQFQQPSSSAIALNRVNSNSASQINGTLTANGNIIIINQNGVMFGAGANVNVNSLVATTANISDSDFMNATGPLNFNQPGNNPNAAIVNNGTITAAQAGLVGLVAPNVVNNGVITANLGKVQLASGDTATIDMYGDGLMSVAVSNAVTSQLVANNGLIQAAGGKVQLTAAAGSQVINSLITVSGEIKTPAVAEKDGEIYIYAAGSNAVPGNVAANKGKTSGSSEVLVSGTLDASGKGTGQTGGTITVTGDHVGILSGANIDASGDAGGGVIQIGGDFHGQGTTPTAEATIVQSGANINASAITSGNGGSVAVWSDNYTNFAGTIEATGGSQSGNGGYVETSGKINLQMDGIVDASAPHGLAGIWLLDPEDAVLTNSDSDETGGDGSTSFTPGGNQGTSDINVSHIDASLNAGTSVTVTTGGDSESGPNGGSITVAADIAKTAGTDATLTLSAATDIIVDTGISISSTTGKLNVVLDADTAATGGAITINTGSSIVTNGGAIYMGGGALDGSGHPLGAAVGDAAHLEGIEIVSATLTTGGGAIVLTGTGYSETESSFASGFDGVSIGSSTISTGGEGRIYRHRHRRQRYRYQRRRFQRG